MDRLTRFFAKVDRGADCWIWRGSMVGKGYGKFWNGERLELAHRFSWRMTFGPIPDGKMVCHHCDTPACVNPAHLFLGDPIDNVRDMDEKGRRRVAIKSHCKRGHALIGDNIKLDHAGDRQCAICHCERVRAKKARYYLKFKDQLREKNRLAYLRRKESLSRSQPR